MKKKYLLILLIPFLFAGVSIVGTMWKQIGTVVYPADDVTGIDFRNITSTIVFNTISSASSNSSGGGGGTIIVKQIVNRHNGALITGTTVIPRDNSKPQSNEGFGIISTLFTATDPTDYLQIDIETSAGSNVAIFPTLALFHNTSTTAMSAIVDTINVADHVTSFGLTYHTPAPIGTTDPIMFKALVGPHTASTLSVNGVSGGGSMDGIMATTMTIKQYSKE